MRSILSVSFISLMNEKTTAKEAPIRTIMTIKTISWTSTRLIKIADSDIYETMSPARIANKSRLPHPLCMLLTVTINGSFTFTISSKRRNDRKFRITILLQTELLNKYTERQFANNTHSMKQITSHIRMKRVSMIEYEDVQANTNAYRIIMKIMRTLNDKNSDSVIWKTKLLKKNIITEKQNQTSFGYRMDGAGFDKTYKVNPCVKMVPNILAIASAVIPFNYPPQRCYSLQKSNPERSFSAF